MEENDLSTNNQFGTAQSNPFMNTHLQQIFTDVINRMGMNEFDSHVFINMFQRRYPLIYSDLLLNKDDRAAHSYIGFLLEKYHKELGIEKVGTFQYSNNIHDRMTIVPLWRVK